MVVGKYTNAVFDLLSLSAFQSQQDNNRGRVAHGRRRR